MKLVDLKLLADNVNTQAKMPQDVLDALRIGGCNYIEQSRFSITYQHLLKYSGNAGSELPKDKLKRTIECNVLTIKVQNIAMMLYNFFFLKKSYLTFDREMVLIGCILVAAKT